MHRKHLILMVLGCALPMMALAAVLIFQVNIARPALFALFLLCPLSHLLMLRYGHGEHRENADHG